MSPVEQPTCPHQLWQYVVLALQLLQSLFQTCERDAMQHMWQPDGTEKNDVIAEL
jgi:hypothetical protein